jgi:hypothetical protein
VAETKGQSTGLIGSVMKTPVWDVKKQQQKMNKIRTSALSNSSMEICWKRKKGEKEKYVRKRNRSQLTVRNFANVSLRMTVSP